MDNIQKKMLTKKGASTLLTADNDVIVCHKMKNGKRKLSGMLSDGTAVRECPVITCHKKKGITGIAAHAGSLTKEDLALANKAIDILDGSLSADFVR
ncbi:MAG: hypothetical protein ACKUBY_01890 [Candidatus Moraniibacteriota bacterium]|jgi:hypothetical protein